MLTSAGLFMPWLMQLSISPWTYRDDVSVSLAAETQIVQCQLLQQIVMAISCECCCLIL